MIALGVTSGIDLDQPQFIKEDTAQRGKVYCLVSQNLCHREDWEESWSPDPGTVLIVTLEINNY